MPLEKTEKLEEEDLKVFVFSEDRRVRLKRSVKKRRRGFYRKKTPKKKRKINNQEKRLKFPFLTP